MHLAEQKLPNNSQFALFGWAACVELKKTQTNNDDTHYMTETSEMLFIFHGDSIGHRDGAGQRKILSDMLLTNVQLVEFAWCCTSMLYTILSDTLNFSKFLKVTEFGFHKNFVDCEVSSPGGQMLMRWAGGSGLMLTKCFRFFLKFLILISLCDQCFV